MSRLRKNGTVLIKGNPVVGGICLGIVVMLLLGIAGWAIKGCMGDEAPDGPAGSAGRPQP